ncbi:MAG: 2-hydroxyacyl-CoA dehydratase [bacterium]|nr:2-hydroxyacyl-CoA dehydratase [bacterium]
MKESRLQRLVSPLSEMLYQFNMIIEGYKERNNVKIAALSCDMLPVEILAAFDLIPLHLPSFIEENSEKKGCPCGNCSTRSNLNGLSTVYDFHIVPEKCANKPTTGEQEIPLVAFNNPTGYGEDASVQLHSAIDELLRATGISEIKNIDIKKLQEITAEYDTLRKLIRGISSLRKTRPDLLSNRDLFTIFEAALVFPPALVVNHLAAIMQAMNETPGESSLEILGALVYSSSIGVDNASLLDDIEEAGCLAAEDDCTRGRRAFDLSFNSASEYLYYEILDAFSYKPLCPSIRPAEERYELLYKMIKNHGIELVIFIEDLCCEQRKKEIEFLRIKLMRSGVDPLVLSTENAHDRIHDYISKAAV